jgi:hypothetical protein
VAGGVALCRPGRYGSVEDVIDGGLGTNDSQIVSHLDASTFEHRPAKGGAGQLFFPCARGCPARAAKDTSRCTSMTGTGLVADQASTSAWRARSANAWPRDAFAGQLSVPTRRSRVRVLVQRGPDWSHEHRVPARTDEVRARTSAVRRPESGSPIGMSMPATVKSSIAVAWRISAGRSGAKTPSLREPGQD